MDGFIIINKKENMTSRDVVNIVILFIIGHK